MTKGYRQSREQWERHMRIILLVNQLTQLDALKWRRRRQEPFTLRMPAYETVMVMDGKSRRLMIGGDDKLKLGVFYAHGGLDEIITFNRASVLTDLYNSARIRSGDKQDSEVFMDRVLAVLVEDLIRQQLEVSGSKRKSPEGDR